MNRLLIPVAALAIGLAGGAWTPAHAAVAKPAAQPAAAQAHKSCRNAKGRFEKCPVAPAATAAKHCRDASGKFTKCST